MRSYLVFVACPAAFRNNGRHLSPPPLPTVFVGSVGYVLRDGMPASGWVGFGILCAIQLAQLNEYRVTEACLLRWPCEASRPLLLSKDGGHEAGTLRLEIA